MKVLSVNVFIYLNVSQTQRRFVWMERLEGQILSLVHICPTGSCRLCRPQRAALIPQQSLGWGAGGTHRLLHPETPKMYFIQTGIPQSSWLLELLGRKDLSSAAFHTFLSHVASFKSKMKDCPKEEHGLPRTAGTKRPSKRFPTFCEVYFKEDWHLSTLFFRSFKVSFENLHFWKWVCLLLFSFWTEIEPAVRNATAATLMLRMQRSSHSIRPSVHPVICVSCSSGDCSLSPADTSHWNLPPVFAHLIANHFFSLRVLSFQSKTQDDQFQNEAEAATRRNRGLSHLL